MDPEQLSEEVRVIPAPGRTSVRGEIVGHTIRQHRRLHLISRGPEQSKTLHRSQVVRIRHSISPQVLRWASRQVEGRRRPGERRSTMNRGRTLRRRRKSRRNVSQSLRGLRKRVQTWHIKIVGCKLDFRCRCRCSEARFRWTSHASSGVGADQATGSAALTSRAFTRALIEVVNDELGGCNREDVEYPPSSFCFCTSRKPVPYACE